MKKKSGKTLMQKWKNKIGGKLSALDKKKLVLTNTLMLWLLSMLTGHFFFTGTVREEIWGTNYYMQWNTQTGFLLVLC